MIKFMNSGNERHLPVVQRIKFCLFLIKIHSLIPNEVALVSKMNLKLFAIRDTYVILFKLDDFHAAQNLINPFFRNHCRKESDPTWNDTGF